MTALRLLLLTILAGLAASCSTPTSATASLSMTCPSVPVATSLTGAPVLVSFTSPAVKNGASTWTATCLPQSGAAFPVGTTSVTCNTAPDTTRAASCTFGVTVQSIPRLTYTRFLAFGDSITAGVISESLPGASLSLLRELGLMDPESRAAFLERRLITDNPNAYPQLLQNRLSARFPQQSFVVLNEGKGAEFAVEGEGRLPGMLALYNPEVLVLMEGTNDLLNPGGPDVAIAALDRMLLTTLAQGRKVCLATIPPVRANGPSGAPHRVGQSARVPAFNDRIRALAAARNVPVVDVYNALQNDVLHLIGIDDLHPTVRGYQVMADTFASAIRTAFEQPALPNVIRK